MKILITFAAAAAMLCAQAAATKKMPAGGVLQPGMKVAADAGTFDKPMAKMGEKAAEPWSNTSVTAGVEGKPRPGSAMTVSGEIVDMSCYLQLGKHGEKHVACGKKCLANGQPIGLVTAAGDIYLLMEEEHDPRRDGATSAFRKAATDHLGHIMEVTGTAAGHMGVRGLFVQGYVAK